MVEFFIKRPKFAIVLSLVMTIAGLLTMMGMSVSLYPSIAPPSINITALYPGADHNTIRDTVASVIEQQVNGVEGMLYIDSKSSNDGSYVAKVTFEIGTDPDLAATLVQNRVNIAMPSLPAVTKQLGVKVYKVSPSTLLALSLYSPNGSYDDVFLSNYFNLNMRDALLRVPGIGEVKVLGEKLYSMRIWLDNEKMAAVNLGPAEVAAAIQAQNTTVSAGKLGESPTLREQIFQYAIQTRGRLKDLEEFENIALRVAPNGGVLRLKDVARIELGSQAYQASAKYGENLAPLIMAYQAPGANALEVAAGLKETLNLLKRQFPEDIDFAIINDSTRFIDASMYEVYETLIIALILVMMVSYIFIQNWRATLIPSLAIPVSLVGTFIVMSAFGMDINTISMFGLILAIGVVVDAAIVVIENVERLMKEKGLAAPEATSEAMKEVTAPLIASALVLLAVFVPVSMAPGMVGILYQQFGVAIVASTLISTLVALTLTPALCAVMLKPHELTTKGPLGWFNRAIDGLEHGYGGAVGFLGRHFVLTLTLFAVLLGGIAYIGSNVPSAFLPAEDQGSIIVDVSLPEASTLDRTQEQMDAVVRQVEAIPGVTRTASVAGFSLLKGALATNSGLLMIGLDDWGNRKTPELSVESILGQVNAALAANRDIRGLALVPPPIPGLGNSSGLTMQLEDTLGRPTETLGPVLQQFVGDMMARPEVSVAFSLFTAQVPQLRLDIDYEEAMRMGLNTAEVNSTLSTMMGGQYVNDFTLFGKNYRVYIMGDAQFRAEEDDLRSLHVRASSGEMVPYSAFAEFKPLVGADVSARYNLFNSTQVLMVPAPGYSSGEAIKAATEVAANLPEGYAIEWTGQTFQEIRTGGGAIYLFLLAVLFTYLFLVAQYESWMTPFAIMLCVPTALLGSLLYVLLAGGTLNLYVQIGLVLMIGMSARNAILIVEFAKLLREERGYSILDAAVQAARLRMRAVLMTAFSFILGVVPLIIAAGAGAGSRQAVGQTVFGGMLSATFIGCIFVPVFFAMFQSLREKLKGAPADGE